ncbi:NlpC/P60 family protein [Falsirhodobacter halotolerans]|uniref:NlpC/P60 family protein n=1 Tax=Falsirhodobacter halotolerans TaxID=1146892 RepID=UPI001FD1423E|nr:NlpC/P60 family protein [Falsirhodobacter halotolerans]
MREAIVVEARRWIGTPYVHQADVRGAGTDCLGLLRGVWRCVMGPEPEEVPPYTEDWSEPSGDEALMRAAKRWLTPASDLSPIAGNVLLFRMRHGAVAKHLGIVSGPASFIHAYTGHGVVESPLSAPWKRRIAACFAFPERI